MCIRDRSHLLITLRAALVSRSFSVSFAQLAPMKFQRSSLGLFAAVSICLTPGLCQAEPDAGQIMISVGRLLEHGHYSRRKLDDTVSKQLLTNYLEALDYNHPVSYTHLTLPTSDLV